MNPAPFPHHAYAGAAAMARLHLESLHAFVDRWRAYEASGLGVPEAQRSSYGSTGQILAHVLRYSAFYLSWSCEQLGLEAPDLPESPGPADAAKGAAAFLERLEGPWRTALRDVESARFQVPYTAPWGVSFTVESMLERAIAHPLRHRLQLDDWAAAG